MPVFKKLKDQKITYAVPDFAGGKNNKFSPMAVEDNESPDVINCDWDDVGSVGTRKGTSKKNTISVGSFACDGLFSTSWEDGTSTMIAFFGGSAWTLSGTTLSTLPSAQSVFTAGQRVGSAQLYNLAFFGNGGIDPYKYDGTNWFKLGVAAPASAPTAGTNSNGTLTGDYLYKVAYVNSQSVEGNPSDASSTFTAASEDIAVTGIPDAAVSHGVNTKYLYRTKTSGSVFYYLDEVSATVSSYTDNISDSALVTLAKVDQNEPKKFSVAVAHQSRLFHNDPDNKSVVWYSPVLEPSVRHANDFINVNTGDGEDVEDIGVMGNAVIFYKTNSIWYLFTESGDSAGWQLVKAISAAGGVSVNGHENFEAQEQQGTQVFLGQNKGKLTGFHLLDQGALAGTALPTYRSNSVSERIEDDIDSIDYDNRDKISAIYFKNKIYFAVPYIESGSSQTTNNRIYLYDYNRRTAKGSIGAFVPWTGLNPACFVAHGGDLYYGSALEDGFVYKMLHSEYTDDGAKIDSYYVTRMYRGPKNMERNRKDFRKAYLWVATPSAYNMEVYYKRLGEAGDGSYKNIDLDPGGSLWGSAICDTDTWGGGQPDAQKIITLGNLSGEGVQFKFANASATTGSTFRVYRMDFDFNLLQPR